MSCSLCRLPFVASPESQFPRPPPPGVLSGEQCHYLQYAVLIGDMVPGGCITTQFFDNNMFGSLASCPIIFNIGWESETGTVIALHAVCATILRHMLDARDLSPQSIMKLILLEQVLGQPQGGPDAGRLPYVDYEGVGEPQDRIDVRPFWILQPGPGMDIFHWAAFKTNGREWALSRPDMFPAFPLEVKQSRFPAYPFPSSPPPSNATFAALPTDVLHLILPFLDTRAFVSLLSTCRLLRLLALTAFQPHARKRILAFGWAMPLPTERAYASEDARAMFADTAQTEGDWMLYLSRVRQSKAMRARQRVWALAEEVRRAYRERESQSRYTYGENGEKSEERRCLERMSWTMSGMARMLSGENLEAKNV